MYFFKEIIANGGKVSGNLLEIGDLARILGLKGKMDNGKFVPSGAGANPFLAPIILQAQNKFLFMFANKNQQVYFEINLEKI